MAAPDYVPDYLKFCFLGSTRGRIIKWTQLIGFLTLAVMERVVEGNHGNNLKEGQQEFCVYRVWRNFIIVYIFSFMSVNKSNACMCYIATLLRLKKIVVS